jgi:cell division protein YceG involved in septum cleavage
MIKLKDLLNLKEAEEKVKPEYSQEAVFKFFSKNKAKLKKCYDNDDWDEFYEIAFEEFADEDQDVVATAMNRAATMEGWFDNETEDYRQSEAELDMMANGTKKQQKGVDNAAYDKKAKTPKASPTDIVVGDLKKLKESKKKK